MAKKIPVSVIQRDVDKACEEIALGRPYGKCCPVSQAFRRTFPGKQVETSACRVTITNGAAAASVVLSHKAQNLIAEFDLNKRLNNLPVALAVEFHEGDLERLGVY